jgi:hypothetical protein
MSDLRVLCRDYPRRAIALTTGEYALIFQYTASVDTGNNPSQSIVEKQRCLLEFTKISSVDLRDYRLLGEAQGTLGLITLNKDVFLCVVTTSSRAATVKPGETILRIDNVEFRMFPRLMSEVPVTNGDRLSQPSGLCHRVRSRSGFSSRRGVQL